MEIKNLKQENSIINNINSDDKSSDDKLLSHQNTIHSEHTENADHSEQINHSEHANHSEAAKQEIIKRLEFFRFFGLSSFIYALFYTFCLFRNPSGVTFPFFVGGTLLFFCLFFKKLEITVKRDSAFCMISLMLLGLSTFLTADTRIHLFNAVMIIILFSVLLLQQLYQDCEWTLTRHVYAFFITIFGTLSCLFKPFQDSRLLLKVSGAEGKADNKKGRFILLGLALSIPFVLVILFLLGSADIVFGYLLTSLLDQIRLPENLIGIVFTTVLIYLMTYGLLSFLIRRTITKEFGEGKTFEPILAITFTSVLSVIYVLFCGIQLLYLFGGQMTLPYNYTYAEYAREGFFQLLAVCFLNLSLVLFCLTKFGKSKILKYMLTVISLCTYIMIFSSAFRMILYIQSYYLTFLRLLVLWALVVIFFLITGIVIQLYRPAFPLFRYSLIGVTCLYLLLSFSHPDYWIARSNLAQADKRESMKTEEDFYQNSEGYSDMQYLSLLSPDAAPAILSPGSKAIFISRQDLESYERYERRMAYESEHLSPRTFNLSRYLAGRLIGRN